MPIASERIIVRRIHPDDYDRGFLGVLSELTKVGEITKAQFIGILVHISQPIEQINKMPVETYIVLVAFDTLENKIVGSGTLVLERKFVHGCGSAGHIEDVVISETRRGQSLGKLLVDALMKEAREAGCYKVILNCNEKNIAFYERCGLARREVQMALYF
jgi:glucosamine-phosphate N-acetyltransferase